MTVLFLGLRAAFGQASAVKLAAPPAPSPSPGQPSTAPAERPAPVPAATPSVLKPDPTFLVTGYEVKGASLIADANISQILSKFTGTNVGIARLLEARAELQMEYRQRGYPTVDVVLPPQKLTNGVVQIEVKEGLLAEILVQKNRYYSSNNVMRALPSLKTNTILNSHVFQRELDQANGSRDRQIYPTIVPGEATNSSTLLLDVKDRLPLHGKVELNNLRTPGTPSFRLNGNASYDNLWQLEHSIGFQYGFSPQSLKPDSVPGYPMTLLDAHRVANYSMFYRMPLFPQRAVSEEVVKDPTSYGYNEATRRFELPPSTGRSELSFYASRSTTDLLSIGERATTIDTALLKIENEVQNRNVTRDHATGMRFTLPQTGSGSIRSSFNFGFDYKDHIAGTFPSNVFYTTSTITNTTTGDVTINRDTTVVPSPTSFQDYNYMTVSAGWQGIRPDRFGQTIASFTLLGGSAAPFMSGVDFRQGNGSIRADRSFGLARMRMARDQKLFGNWKLFVSAEGQYSTDQLVTLEQIGIGGSGSVRGYQEGELYGDNGFFTQAEIRAPLYSREITIDGRSTTAAGSFITFVDYGRVYLKGNGFFMGNGPVPSVDLMGTGVGLLGSVGSHFESRVTLGWALKDTSVRDAGSLLTTFTMGFKF